MVSRPQQRGSFVELQRDVALEHNWRAQVCSRSQSHRSAAVRRTLINRGLNCGGVL